MPRPLAILAFVVAIAAVVVGLAFQAVALAAKDNLIWRALKDDRIKDREQPLDFAEETRESLEVEPNYLGRNAVLLHRKAFEGRPPLFDTFLARHKTTAYLFNNSDSYLYSFDLEADGGGELRRLVKVGGAAALLHLLDGKIESDGSALIACEATMGLIRIALMTGEIQRLSTVSHCNGVDIRRADGDVYFSSAVSVAAIGKGWTPEKTARAFAGSSPVVSHSQALMYLDLLRGGKGTGRLLRYSGRDNKTEVLLNDLAHAAGVALSADGEYVLVVEALHARVIKKWIRGPRAGASESFCLLPQAMGFGIVRTEGSDAGYWLTATATIGKGWLSQRVFNSRRLRTWIARFLPVSWWPEGLLVDPATAIIGVDKQGMLGFVLEDNRDASPLKGIRSVLDFDGLLYLGSSVASSIPAVPIPGALGI